MPTVPMDTAEEADTGLRGGAADGVTGWSMAQNRAAKSALTSGLRLFRIESPSTAKCKPGATRRVLEK